jgi:pimeloyl-ACP methyl ester carboxylesterase
MKSEIISVNEVPLELMRGGIGRPLVVLHGGLPFDRSPEFLEMLERDFEVFAPSHPGFGKSPLPERFDSIDDLVFLYLDFIEQQGLKGVTLLGFCIGGWIAAELAVRCSHRLSSLILVGPFGIKISDRETRDFPDIFALHPDEVMRLAYHQNPPPVPDFASLSDEELLIIAREREALALYAWEPYLHNPKLKYHLNRIKIPTLIVRGAADGLVTETYLNAYSRLIPNSRVLTIPKAGHLPQREQPRMLADKILAFIRD